jgi:hypothetical protein
VFSEEIKIVFENTGAQPAYITAIDIYGDPVIKVDEIIVEEKDTPSITNFDENRYELTTNYIQTERGAVTKASVMVDDYKDYANTLVLTIKSNVALQIDDIVDLSVDGYVGNYVVQKNRMVYSKSGTQHRITVQERSPRQYFILDQSILDGTDVLLF